MTTREALEDLVTSQGWHLLLERAEQEWGVTGAHPGHALTSALAHTESDSPERIGATVLQLQRARAAVVTILRWPHDELRKLDTSRGMA